MEKEIEYILNAVKRIDSHYYSVIGVSGNSEYQQSAENAFAAELYYSLKASQNDFKNLKWHFDLNKENAGNIRPDLVLHKSPSNRDDQRIFIEIKTAKNVTKQSIAKDLSKLVNAVSENNLSSNLGYSFGIYIVGNSSIEKIIQEISSINIGDNILKKLHLIHFMSENYNPICESFYSLISNNSKTPHIVALM